MLVAPKTNEVANFGGLCSSKDLALELAQRVAGMAGNGSVGLHLPATVGKHPPRP